VFRGPRVSLGAVRLQRHLRPPPGIRLRTDGLKMIRINACPVPAEMVDLHALWNRPDVALVRESMSMARLSLDPDAAVTGVALRPDPFPAMRRLSDLGVKALVELCPGIGSRPSKLPRCMTHAAPGAPLPDSRSWLQPLAFAAGTHLH
jgi:hypothetical protein